MPRGIEVDKMAYSKQEMREDAIALDFLVGRLDQALEEVNALTSEIVKQEIKRPLQDARDKAQYIKMTLNIQAKE
jgi:hypothetical protein